MFLCGQVSLRAGKAMMSASDYGSFSAWQLQLNVLRWKVTQRTQIGTSKLSGLHGPQRTRRELRKFSALPVVEDAWKEEKPEY